MTTPGHGRWRLPGRGRRLQCKPFHIGRLGTEGHACFRCGAWYAPNPEFGAVVSWRFIGNEQE